MRFALWKQTKNGQEVIETILNLYGMKCYLCQHKLYPHSVKPAYAEWRHHLSKYELTFDHVIPQSLGGEHSVINLRPACRSCNTKKFNRLDYQPNSSSM